MNLLVKDFGSLCTNCYILINDEGESIIIDPGVNSEDWVLSNVTNKPVAILNTHAHYDHTFGNGKLQKKLKVPLIIHENDVHLLSYSNEWQKRIPECCPTHIIREDVLMNIGSFEFKAIWLPGHTLGTCIFDFDETIFSGDFVMENTVGRYNLFTSDKTKQFDSLNKFLSLYSGKQKKITVYPGHGREIKLHNAIETVKKWIAFF